MTKTFAIIFTVLSLALFSFVWAQMINMNEEESTTTKTASIEKS